MQPEDTTPHLWRGALAVVRGGAVVLCALAMVACAGPTATISVPIGPFGHVGVNVGSGGAVSGHIGVGTRAGGVSVGAGVDVPIKDGQ